MAESYTNHGRSAILPFIKEALDSFASTLPANATIDWSMYDAMFASAAALAGLVQASALDSNKEDRDKHDNVACSALSLVRKNLAMAIEGANMANGSQTAELMAKKYEESLYKMLEIKPTEKTRKL